MYPPHLEEASSFEHGEKEKKNHSFGKELSFLLAYTYQHKVLY